MKKILLYTTIALLVVNLLCGLIISAYHPFNIVVSSIVIIINALLCHVTATSKIKDAFKISLTGIYTVVGIVEFLIALFMPRQFSDNWCLIIIILLLGFEALIHLVVSKVSTDVSGNR